MIAAAAALSVMPALRAMQPTADERLAEARGLLAQGNADAAIAAFREIARIDPRNAAAHAALGSLLNRAGRYAEALPYAETAVVLDPANGRYRYNRGVVRAEHGWFAEAIADFDAALVAHPDLAYAYLERGAARLAVGQAAEARQDWARAREVDPALIWTHWYPATANVLDGDYAEAAAAFDRVAAAEPGFVPALLWRVIAHRRAGRAIDVPTPASADWPAPVLEFYRGRIDANRLLGVARQDRDSGDRRREGEAHYFIAQQALIAGHRDAATAHFRRALAIPAPRHVWKLSAEAELRRLEAGP